jgi:isopropylmalate/homocitrate/citramalate synthase
LGRAMNSEVYKTIKILRNYFTADFEVHLYNDLGHAVSNALYALQAGANWISTSLLGIGERTDITPLSSLLVNLYILDSRISKRYNLQYLTSAENFVSRVCGIEIPLNLMTNRNNGFAHKAGIHLNTLLNFGPQKYELLSPEIIRNRRKLVFNSSISGRTNKIDVMKFKKKYR